ncbi:MAG: putative ABC transport system permease protein [Phycisphaerales bacterium]|jgi:putative ABC transport system permease protein
MRAAWQLTRSGLWARPARTALLCAAVALSAALVTAVACALASVNHAVSVQLDARMGTAEARLIPAGRGQSLTPEALETVRAWPGVEFARPKAQSTISLVLQTELLEPAQGGETYTPQRELFRASAVLNGLAADPENADNTGDAGDASGLGRLRLIAGRPPEKTGEIVIDALLAQRLSSDYNAKSKADNAMVIGRARIAYLDRPTPELPESADAATAERLNRGVGPRPGDTVNVVRFLKRTIPLTVVGITEPPPLGGRPQAYASLATSALVAGDDPSLSEIEIELAAGLDAEAFDEAHADRFAPGAILQTTERITSGVEKNISSNRIAYILASSLAFLSAAFIIMTGLATGMAEQQRSLAVLRCIGATRWQLAGSQLLTGTTIGFVGAVVGVPLGLGMAWLLVTIFADRLPTGLTVPPTTLSISVVGAIAAGLVGALWPAWQAARLTPLQGLAARATPTTRRSIVITTLAALAGLAIMFASVLGPDTGQGVFWAYATVGLPMMFIGYFLLSIPVALVVARVLDPVLSMVLRVPPNLVRRTVSATPYRFGFTAGAMMAGLALMISIWTNGSSFMNDWIARIQFPDAFVSGLALTEEDQAKVDALPFVQRTCSVSMQPVKVDSFGVRALQSYSTTFVAFEPEPFFAITNLEFIQGDPAYAQRRLIEGGAVLVAREFLVAQGLGAGDTFVCRDAQGGEHEFEIVGVVTSPGLELVSKFFNIGEEFIDQSLHAVFGSRADLKEHFGATAIQLIQIQLTPGSDDAQAVATIRKELFGSSVIDAGSGRRIKSKLIEFVGSTLVVFSAVAIGSMLVACCGVANLVVAGIQARRFEFGVLRAVGGSRGVLTRLILAEALVVGVTACLIGTAMGVQGAWAGTVLYSGIIGISMTWTPPITPVLWGWGFVLALTLLAAWPAIGRLNRQRPKDLLRSVA